MPPVRQVSSGSSEVITECDEQAIGGNQVNSGSEEQALEDRIEGADAEGRGVNCR